MTTFGKILIAGGSGFVGSALQRDFRARGIEVKRLVRNPSQEGIYWNPEKRLVDHSHLEGMDGVINLCGENILGRWTERKKESIQSSRLLSTQFLCQVLSQLRTPPRVYIGASAIGYYGERGNEPLNEESQAGRGFLAQLCQQWEQIPVQLLTPKGIRSVITRFGIVLGREGPLSKMSLPFKYGMGGVLGSGEQFVSWVAIDDVAAAIHHILETPILYGPVNVTSPYPVTNREMTLLLGKVLHRPTFFSIPAFALRLLYGSAATLLLGSTRVFPEKLLKTGFRFHYPSLEEAFKKYLINNTREW